MRTPYNLSTQLRRETRTHDRFIKLAAAGHLPRMLQRPVWQRWLCISHLQANILRQAIRAEARYQRRL